jgi:flagellar protein FlaJ
MKWPKFWKKDSEEEFVPSENPKPLNKEILSMDFFCQLSYMAAIATSGISRSGLFQHAANLPYVSARYFKKANFVAKAFNHDYAEACRVVGQSTNEPEVKAFLLRLSGALSSGEDIAIFLERESQVFSDSYGNEYERRLEVLRKWTDAYVALIMTSAIVIVMAVVTMMIGSITRAFIFSLSTLTIVVTLAGAWLIYHTAPREIKVHSLPCRSKEQNVVRGLARLSIPMMVIIIVAMIVMKIDIGWIMLGSSFLIFPMGVICKKDDQNIDKRDTDIAGLLRSLGGVSQAIRATVSEAMGRLDFRSVGFLKEDVELLYTRLLAGINPNRCWERFVGETGSEQVSRSVRIFWDGIALGGEPERVGNDASAFAMKIAHLRAQRALISSGIQWLAIAMHLVLSVVVVFIYQTLLTFTNLVNEVTPTAGLEEALSGLTTFGIFGGSSAEIDLLYFMVIVIIIVLTLANSFAIYATGGGHIFKLSFYLAIMSAISGAVLIFVPPVVNMMLTGMM